MVKMRTKLENRRAALGSTASLPDRPRRPDDTGSGSMPLAADAFHPRHGSFQKRGPG